MRGSNSFPRAGSTTPPSGETGYTMPSGSIFKLQANLTSASIGDNVPTILDRSGNSTDASVVAGNATYQVVGGKPVLRFNGSSYYNIPFAFTTKPANWTIIAVVAFSSVSGSTFICGSIDATGASAKGWGILGNAGAALSYQFGDDTNYKYAVANTSTLTANTRSRIAVRYVDGDSSATVNQDGSALAFTNSGSAIHSTGAEQPFSIGKAGAYSGGIFVGDLYFLQIWPRALTDSELAAVETSLISAGF